MVVQRFIAAAIFEGIAACMPTGHAPHPPWFDRYDLDAQPPAVAAGAAAVRAGPGGRVDGLPLGRRRRPARPALARLRLLPALADSVVAPSIHEHGAPLLLLAPPVGDFRARTPGLRVTACVTPMASCCWG